MLLVGWTAVNKVITLSNQFISNRTDRAMGRKSTWNKTFDDWWPIYRAQGLDVETCRQRAAGRANSDEEDQKKHRRYKLAEYQHRYRLKHKPPTISESESEDEDYEEVTIRVSLFKCDLDFLDKMGQAELKAIGGGFLTTSRNRSHMIRMLISNAMDNEERKNQRTLKAMDRAMATVKQFIVMQREQGVSDAEIEQGIAKMKLGVSSIAEAEAYEYKSDEIKERYSAHSAQQDKSESQE